MKHARADYDRRIVDLDNKIPEDEPVFLLRGQDVLAPRLLLMWATELRLAGGDPEMARTAENHAQAMIEWQKKNGSKTPDMYRDTEGKKVILDRIKDILVDCKNSDIRELTELLSEYYGREDGQLYVLLRSDAKPQSKLKDIDFLTLDDFILEDIVSWRKSKLTIFTDKTKFKVLNSKL